MLSPSASGIFGIFGLLVIGLAQAVERPRPVSTATKILLVVVAIALLWVAYLLASGIGSF